jgi:hypothetical protein
MVANPSPVPFAYFLENQKGLEDGVCQENSPSWKYTD